MKKEGKVLFSDLFEYFENMKNMLDEAWGVCYYNTRFVGQAVKTPPSHGGNTGSIPVRTAKYLKPVHSWKHDVPAFSLYIFIYEAELFMSSCSYCMFLL